MWRRTIINSLAVALYAVVFISMCSCDATRIDEALNQAGENRKEIERFLSLYDDKYSGYAEYLVAAMRGFASCGGNGIDSIEAIYRKMSEEHVIILDQETVMKAHSFVRCPRYSNSDLQCVTSEFLCENLGDALMLKNCRKWNAELPDSIFNEALLPYRIADEPLTSWRKYYRDHFADIEHTLDTVTNSVDAAVIIAARMEPILYNDQFSTPHRSAIKLLDVPVGYCREECDRMVYAMRSLGVPVVTDIMPVSPDNGGSHQWNAVYDTDSHIYRMFDSGTYLPTRDSIHYDNRRRGKVFRQTFAPDYETLARNKVTSGAPDILLIHVLRMLLLNISGTIPSQCRLMMTSRRFFLGYSPKINIKHWIMD